MVAEASPDMTPHHTKAGSSTWLCINDGKTLLFQLLHFFKTLTFVHSLLTFPFQFLLLEPLTNSSFAPSHHRTPLSHHHLLTEKTCMLYSFTSICKELQDKIVEIISKHMDTFGWSSADIPRINPDFLCHRLTMDER